MIKDSLGIAQASFFGSLSNSVDEEF